MTGYKRFVHGEAVGYGMEVAAELAVALGMCAPRAAARIRDLVAAVGPRPPVRDIRLDRVLEAMQNDKKRSGGGVPFILPTAVGGVEIRRSSPETEIRGALERAFRTNGR